MKKETSLEEQLGYYVGEFIIANFLPTLSIDMIKTRNIIKVSQDQEETARKLEEIWFNNLKEFSIKKEKDSESVDWNWVALRTFHEEIERAYLPEELVCHVPNIVINIKNISELKNGIRVSLWESDLCHYNINVNNIDIIFETFSTVIKFKRGL